MTIVDFLSDNSGFAIAIAIAVTIVALVISTRYSIRNLLNLRQSPLKVAPEKDEDATCAAQSMDGDTAGHDGDDEADVDDDNAEDVEESDQSLGLSPRYPDPIDYCEHIQGEIKRVQQQVATKSIEKNLSQQQLEEEREVQRGQLADIFRLMQEQQDRFGIESMDDMQEQMKLYAV